MRLQDNQSEAELGHIRVAIDDDRRAKTEAGPAGAVRQMRIGTNPSALPVHLLLRV
jgi:hypothetical protein